MKDLGWMVMLWKLKQLSSLRDAEAWSVPSLRHQEFASKQPLLCLCNDVTFLPVHHTRLPMKKVHYYLRL